MAGGTTLLGPTVVALNGAGAPVNCHGLGGQYQFSTEASGVVTAGAIQVQQALRREGPWEALGAPITVTPGGMITADVAGPLEWIRALVSTAITGGGGAIVRVRMPLTW